MSASCLYLTSRRSSKEFKRKRDSYKSLHSDISLIIEGKYLYDVLERYPQKFLKVGHSVKVITNASYLLKLRQLFAVELPQIRNRK